MKTLTTTSIAAAAIAAIGMAAPAQADITVVSWGGAYTKSQVEAYHKPFTKTTGIKILSEDYNGGIAKIKAQVETKNVTWDVVDMEPQDVQRACEEGLLEKIDASVLPAAPDGTAATKDFVDGALHECAVATIVWSTIYAYDKTKFKGNEPKTVADFFNVKKFPGKRGMRKTPEVNLEWALIADGVPGADVYKVLATKEGQDRAFKKLDTIKGDVVWWEAGAQPPQLLADGQVAMTTAYNGRIFNAIASEKKPFEIVWDHQIWSIDMWGIVKGSKNMKEAMEFVKFSTGTKALADQASWISYGPARKSSFPMVGKFHDGSVDMKPHMPTAPDNFKNSIKIGTAFWSTYKDELSERFTSWLAK